MEPLEIRRRQTVCFSCTSVLLSSWQIWKLHFLLGFPWSPSLCVVAEPWRSKAPLNVSLWLRPYFPEPRGQRLFHILCMDTFKYSETLCNLLPGVWEVTSSSEHLCPSTLHMTSTFIYIYIYICDPASHCVRVERTGHVTLPSVLCHSEAVSLPLSMPHEQAFIGHWNKESIRGRMDNKTTKRHCVIITHIL